MQLPGNLRKRRERDPPFIPSVGDRDPRLPPAVGDQEESGLEPLGGDSGSLAPWRAVQLWTDRFQTS